MKSNYRNYFILHIVYYADPLINRQKN